MTAADMWALVSSGGTTATLLIVLWLLLTERLTTGAQTQRERQRSEMADQQADAHQELLKRVLLSAEDSLQQITALQAELRLLREDLRRDSR